MTDEIPQDRIAPTTGDNIQLAALIEAIAPAVEVASDPTTLAPSPGRVVRDADDGTVYIADGDAWLDVQAAVGLEAKRPRTGTYTGDGDTTGRALSLGYEPEYAVVHRTGGAVEQITMPTDESTADVVVGGSLTTSVETSTSCYITADGLVVGDGDNTGNVNGETYRWEAW